MNWKLIFALSLFGLANALASISLLPEGTDNYYWPLVFIICAVLIARFAHSKYFLHGFVTCLLNCIWITGAHIIWANMYVQNHPHEAEMMRTKINLSTREAMLMIGPLIGVGSGLFLGLLAFIASKLMKRKVTA